jgi:threonyl-tRNA synthetase
VGCLIEHFAGAFPLWLAPIQVRVLPITDDQAAAARALSDRFRKAGIRSELDDRNDTLNYRIRDAELLKVPYMAVVGQREVEQGTVAVRARGAERKQEIMPADAFLERLREQIASRTLTLDASA